MRNKITPKVPLIETADGEYDSFYSDDLEKVINQNLKMILLTRRGERTMIPDFGAGVQDFLFEISTGQTISNLRSIKITYSIDATGAVSTFEQTIDNMI
jgi:phage baseplate assembly protein W